MKRTTLISILTISILAIGCGGSTGLGGSTSGGGSGGGGGNPFDGAWGGTWASPSTGRTGKATITVTNGSIDGTAIIDNTQEKGPFRGVISKAGDVTATVEYPHWPVIQISGRAKLEGGRMKGDLEQSVNGSTSTFRIDLGRK